MRSLIVLSLAAAHLFPSVLALTRYFGPALWVLASLVATLALYAAYRCVRPSRVGRMGVGLLSGLIFFLNLQLAVSYFTQGTGFNDAFLVHATLDSVHLAWKDHPGLVLLCLAAQLLTILAPLRRWGPPAAQEPHWSLAFGFCVLSLVASYPLWSMTRYLMSEETVRGYGAAPLVSPAAAVGSAAGTPKNIILIYAEQVEQLYLNEQLFPEQPLEALGAIYADSLRFTNVRQERGAGWTTAGLIASQCGFAVEIGHHAGNNSRLAAVERPYPDAQCLGDFLLEQGYETRYLGGAPNGFGGKGNFLKTHGFQSVYGFDELEPRLAGAEVFSTWGVFDDDLLRLAREEVSALESGSSPYLLTLLTLGTHHPEGILSPSCARYRDADNPMLGALQCTDDLLSAFIGELQKMTDPERTVIAVVADHLALRNTLSRRLRQQEGARRILFFLPNEAPKIVSDTMSQFDVGPTVLEAAGFPADLQLGFGRSFFSGYQPEHDAPGPGNRRTRARTMLTGNVFDSGVEIAVAENRVSIGDTDLKITTQVGYFSVGYYLLVLNQKGDLYDVIYTRDPQAIAKTLDGRPAIALVRHEEGAPAHLYIGHLSASEVFRGSVFDLQQRSRFTGAELQRFLQ